MTPLWSLLPACLLLTAVEGGYYKIRPPHPPPPPPSASLHYGPHPPHHYHRPHHYPYYHRPHHRVYHQRYPKPPLPPPYPTWKNSYSATFRAPIVKETFSTPQSLYTPVFLKDDDKGPIHTIPAPNLGPADRPSLFQPEAFKNDGFKKPLHSTEEDLAAVLRHGLTKVNVPQSPGYQVTEDPAAASPSNTPGHSYFAPDPDPEVPTLKIPPTTDPHSLPSNGLVPLDLYLQQQAENNNQYGHYQRPVEHSNTLTPQELFNLLNYQQPSTLQQQVQFLLPQQANHLFSHGGQQELVQQQLAQQEFTNQHLAQHPLPHQQFAQPQYQTFNYEEQGQQGLYGDLKLDLQTKGFGVHQKDLLEDNDVAGSEKEESYENVVANEVVQHQIHQNENIGKEKQNVIEKVQFPKKHVETETTVYHPNLIASKVPNGKLIPHNQNQDIPTGVQRENTDIDNSQTMTSVKPENNVQLQKSIQIYENTYANNEDIVKQEIKNMNEFNNEYSEEEKVAKETPVGIEEEKLFSNGENVHFVDAVPYGSRIRPKRF